MWLIAGEGVSNSEWYVCCGIWFGNTQGEYSHNKENSLVLYLEFQSLWCLSFEDLIQSCIFG